MGEVVAPDGRSWHVERRLLPWRPRWRGWGRQRGPGAGSPVRALVGVVKDVLSFADDIPFIGPLLGLVVVGLVLVVVVVIPVTMFLVEVALVVTIVVVGGVLGPLVRRPWLVEARTQGPPVETRRWTVGGGRRSRRFVDEVRAALQQGADPPNGDHIRAEKPGTAAPTSAEPTGFLRSERVGSPEAASAATPTRRRTRRTASASNPGSDATADAPPARTGDDATARPTAGDGAGPPRDRPGSEPVTPPD